MVCNGEKKNCKHMCNVSRGEVSVDSRGNSSALLKCNYRTRVKNTDRRLLKSIKTKKLSWVKLWGPIKCCFCANIKLNWCLKLVQLNQPEHIRCHE